MRKKQKQTWNTNAEYIAKLEHENHVYREALKAISKVNCSSYYYRAKASEALVEGER